MLGCNPSRLSPGIDLWEPIVTGIGGARDCCLFIHIALFFWKLRAGGTKQKTKTKNKLNNNFTLAPSHFRPSWYTLDDYQSPHRLNSRLHLYLPDNVCRGSSGWKQKPAEKYLFDWTHWKLVSWRHERRLVHSSTRYHWRADMWEGKRKFVLTKHQWLRGWAQTGGEGGGLTASELLGTRSMRRKLDKRPRTRPSRKPSRRPRKRLLWKPYPKQSWRMSWIPMQITQSIIKHHVNLMIIIFLNSLLNKMKSKINVNIHIFVLVRNIIFPLFLLLFSPFFSQRSNVVANADICQKERGE